MYKIKCLGEEGEEIYLFKVLVLGDECTGKSCLALRFCDETFAPTHYHTNWVDMKIRCLYNIYGKTVKLQVWDAPGTRFGYYQRREYASQRPLAYIFLYDITNRQSFNSLNSWVEEYITQANIDQPVDLLLLGTKSDLEEQRMVSPDEAKNFADLHNMDFMEVSALQNVGVEEAFDRLASKFMLRHGDVTLAAPTKSAQTHTHQQQNSPPLVESSIHLQQQSKDRKRNCAIM